MNERHTPAVNCCAWRDTVQILAGRRISTRESIDSHSGSDKCSFASLDCMDSQKFLNSSNLSSMSNVDCHLVSVSKIGHGARWARMVYITFGVLKCLATALAFSITNLTSQHEEIASPTANCNVCAAHLIPRTVTVFSGDSRTSCSSDL